jgi:hypothetical protein
VPWSCICFPFFLVIPDSSPYVDSFSPSGNMKIQTTIFRNIFSCYNENDSVHVAASKEFTKSTFYLFCGLLYDVANIWTIQGWMVRWQWIMNRKECGRKWSQVVSQYLWGGIERNNENFSLDSHNQDFNVSHLKHKSEALLLWPSC